MSLYQGYTYLSFVWSNFLDCLTYFSFCIPFLSVPSQDYILVLGFAMTVSQRQVTVPLRLILADSVKVVYDCNCLNDDKLQVGDNSQYE